MRIIHLNARNSVIFSKIKFISHLHSTPLPDRQHQNIQHDLRAVRNDGQRFPLASFEFDWQQEEIILVGHNNMIN